MYTLIFIKKNERIKKLPSLLRLQRNVHLIWLGINVNTSYNTTDMVRHKL